jgi:hypothetical protein
VVVEWWSSGGRVVVEWWSSGDRVVVEWWSSGGRVVVEGVASSFLTVTSVVPQGSVFGPLPILIYANDLPNAANHSIVPNPNDCWREISQPRDRDLLHADLKLLHQWSSTWDLKFNTNKCAALQFSRKKFSVPPQECLLNQQSIILVSNNLKWSPHIINIVAKANKMLRFLWRNCFHLTDVTARRLLYLSLVRSLVVWLWTLGTSRIVCLPPATSAWPAKKAKKPLRRRVKFILQDCESSYVDRLKKLNLIPLSYLHEIKDIMFFYKCKSGMYELDINQSLHHSTPFQFWWFSSSKSV